VIDDDVLHDECGIFGVVAPGRDASRLTFFALHALQHRGQESAGIAVSDGTHLTVQRELGLVAQVFNETALRTLTGHSAIGHVRYSTTGANKWDNAQPVVHPRGHGAVALGHNGNLTNADLLRAGMSDAERAGLAATTDSELIAALIGHAPGSLLDAACAVMPRLLGAYSVACLSEDELVVFRDPYGVRPLAIGRLEGGGVCVASETCALDQVGAAYERDVRPGEALRIREGRIESRQVLPPERSAFCVFEHIYFARPDSLVDGQTLWEGRRSMGRVLAEEGPAPGADLVVGLPDSGTPAAIGFAAASGIPYAEAVVRSRYVGRSFIQPDQELRAHGVRLKFNPLRSVITGRSLVVVDDSIVRGTTMRQTVAMLYEAGAREVHLRISSPPVAWPCFYGIDIPDRADLAAATRTVPEIAEMTGATSLVYLSLEGLQRAIGRPASGFCRACLTGDYPIPVPDAAVKLRFEAEPGRVAAAR
jgi:amidophosphoribosyltransferase